MPDAWPLRRRRAEIDAELKAVRVTLSPLVSAHPGWVDRLQPIVDAEVARLVQRLATLPGDPQAQWPALTDIAAKQERLAAEALAFVGGVVARSVKLDRGACDLADRLLADVAKPLLVSYHPITVPASGEYVDVMSEVIRVRYPGRGIWDLPIVLHEFGHFLVPRLNSASGASPRAIIEREREIAPYRGAFAEELWADTFATYIGGPAYASTAFSRFDPASAHADRKPTHPAAMTRTVAVSRTLAQLQTAWVRKGQASGSLTPLIDLSQQHWHSRLYAAGVAGEPKNGVPEYATGLCDEFLSILDREHVVSRYDGGQEASAVRRHLDGDDALSVTPSGVDVLNGLWWAFLSAGRPDQAQAFSDAAVGLL